MLCSTPLADTILDTSLNTLQAALRILIANEKLKYPHRGFRQPVYALFILF
jgi:hypothetical protein